MRNYKDIFLRYKNIIAILMIIVIFIAYMKLWFSMDEYYTLDLVHSNYGGMLYKDTFDVHPPLYYIMLKAFFQITLFFHHSIIYEVILGRIFSIIFSLLTVIFLIKINKLIGINLSKATQYIMFLILPVVISAENINLSPFINIRMYSLAGFFVSLTWYSLLKYEKYRENSSLLLMTFGAVLSSYTHYYAALIVGLMLIFTFFYHLQQKDFVDAKKYLCSGIVTILLFLPWVFYAFPNQFKKVNYGQPLFKTLTEIILALIFVFASIIIYKNTSKNQSSISRFHHSFLIIINLTILLITLFYSIIKSPIFLFRYIYPSILLLMFSSLGLIILKIKKGDRTHWFEKCVIGCLLFISLGSFLNEIILVRPISKNLIKNDQNLASKGSKYVNIDKLKYTIPKYDVNNSYMNDDVQVGFYLRSIGKIPYVTDKRRMLEDYLHTYPNSRILVDNVTYKHVDK